MPPTHDYHIHSTYSDGKFLYRMLRAAEEAGLDAVGFADHCNASTRDQARRRTYELGFNLDQTYPRRRAAIDSLRESFDVRVFDAVEMDYDPRDEDDIRAFLDDAGFDYAVGSVHRLDGTNVHTEGFFAAKSEAEQQAYVDDYFEKVVSLVESELFEIAAHVDLVERNPALRGYATADHYERVADAFAHSRTVPEINAGRVLREYGEVHPSPPLLALLLERDVGFTVGTDSHRPRELRERLPVLLEYFEEYGIEPVRLFD
ncbi:PHP domain-containing protein [Haloprofundus halophilus]|nr:PHP domain-containing protein [Haloprofundus halophilus]